MNDAILEKVRKVRNLAERAGTDGEAQSAAAALQRLMVKYGITESDLEIPVEGPRPVANNEADQMKSYTPAWKNNLARVIAENFRCQHYWAKDVGYYDVRGEYRYVHVLRFVGLEQDVALAVECYRIMVAVSDKLAKKYRTQYKKEFGTISVAKAMSMRESYLHGFVSGLEDAFRKQVETQAIVLRVAVEVEEAVAELGLVMTKRRSSANRWDSDARSAGERDGVQVGHSDGLDGGR